MRSPHEPELMDEKMDEKMTVEKLRKHLFEKTKAKFWDYDANQISVGVEVEYFIARATDASFQLATESEYMDTIICLKKDHGYHDRGLPDQPGRVSRDTDSGFVVIKPDFAWHILEISLPPRKTPGEISQLLYNVLHEVDCALSKAKLKRLDISCLPDRPKSMDLVKLDRLGQISQTFQPRRSDRPTQDPTFPAYIAATHVHLNVSSESTLTMMPRLYALDRIINEKFNRARTFCGQSYENVRTSMYRDTLGEDYLLHTYPIKPATNLAELSDQMNRSPKLFPMDTFFPVRDMSYIRPTRYGTLEFRSACSYKNVEKIEEIVRWRLAQFIAASGIFSKNPTAELQFLRQHLQKDSA